MKPNYDTVTGLVPAIVQHAQTGQVLMLTYLNQHALERTLEEKVLAYFDKNKEKVVTKVGTDRRRLQLVSIKLDCNNDSFLVKVIPQGDLNCDKGKYCCYDVQQSAGYINQLHTLINSRIKQPVEGSYTTRMLGRGLNKVLEKIGEEATELIIESKENNEKLFINEAADLMYHFTMLLSLKGKKFEDVERILQERKYK